LGLRAEGVAVPRLTPGVIKVWPLRGLGYLAALCAGMWDRWFATLRVGGTIAIVPYGGGAPAELPARFVREG
jgi:hypothetical protein